MVEETKPALGKEDKPTTPGEENKPAVAGDSKPVVKEQDVPTTEKMEEKPIGDTIEETLEKMEAKDKPEPRLVPQAVLLEYKNQNKELKRDIKELKGLIESGATKKEVSEDLRDIAEEHNVDINFLRKLAKSLEDETEKKIADRFESKFKPYEDKERAEKINKIFNNQWNNVMEEMPEYENVANKEIIRERALNPINAKKTFRQILEESYGHLIDGKRTLETARGRAGQGEITEIDYKRAVTDMDYYKKIMDDPILKREYNKDLGKRLRL